MVMVVLRYSRSPSPEFSTVKRVLPVVGTNFTLSGLPSTAAAVARQKSTSKPAQRPESSGAAKPGTPVVTTQFSSPRAFTSSSVPAFATPDVDASATAADTASVLKSFIGHSLQLLLL